MSVRTQVYLTEEQRARLDERARRDRVPFAELIREAVDRFLELEDDLDATFGVAPPDFEKSIPSRDEWDHRG
ncbi:MAG: ribbon-helix-helix domain-containing protein [Candidatus Dormibacteria bacterium]